MAENVSNQTIRKRRKWPRVLATIFVILIVLIVAVYFIGTSSAFLKGVILPRVSKSLNATVTVADADIHPFKQVVLHDLKVQTTGTDPLFAAREVRARYSLMDIIGGKINVDEATVSAPIINLVENPDGSSNLDPITKSGKAEEAKEKNKTGETKSAKPAQIGIKKVALSDATVRKTKLYKGGKQDVVELSHLNLIIDDLKNGQSGKLTISGDARIDKNPPSPDTNGTLQAKISGNFVFALTSDLKPASVKGNTHLDIPQASGGMAELTSLSSDLDCEVTPTEVRQISLRFQKGGNRLGEVRVSGPLDLEKLEGKLKVEVVSIDKQVLNLASASSGLDFGTTTLNSTNEIQIGNGAKLITASGQVNLNKMQMTRAGQTTPTLDLQSTYGVTVDQAAKSALLKTFTLAATQQAKPLLRGELSSPMAIGLGAASNAVGDAALNISVTDLNVADWKPFVGTNVSSGIVNVTLKVTSQKSGDQLGFELNTRVENLTAGDATNQISQAGVNATVRGQIAGMKKVNLAEYKVQVTHKGQDMLTASGSGTYEVDSKSADIQLLMQATLARLSELAPPAAELAISSGTLNLKSHVTQNASGQTVTGTLSVEGMTGKVSKNQFQNFGLTMDLDILKSPIQIEIRKANGKLTGAGDAGGSFDLSGTYGTNQAAKLTAKLTDFNQNGLRPFLEPMLTDKKLTSVSLNATASVQSSPQGDAAINADLQMTNLVVKDPNNQIPATPLEARFKIDLGIAKKQADLKEMSLTLTPTKLGKNELKAQGKVDLSQPNYQGNLQISAESLDFTTYYDLISGKKSEAEKTTSSAHKETPTSTKTTTSAGPGGTEQEAAAQHLPFRDFNIGVNIGGFYLREVQITNLQMMAKFNGSKLLLDPFKLTLNGAPVNVAADLDLGVPGYKYDTTANLIAVPLEPLVNTFQPERKGQIKGTLTAVAKISGAGTTGASLQKNLNGQFDIGSTNLQLSVQNIQSKLIRGIVEVVSAVPEMINNPGSIAGNLLQGLTGKSSSGGVSGELNKSLIDIISAKGSAGGGKILLQQAVMQSPVFRTEVNGNITLANILTNSPIELPVAILLEKTLAQTAKLGPLEIGNDEKYLRLPTFLTMRGTLGNPKKDISEKVLLGMTAKVAGSLNLGGGKSGNILQGVGSSLLGGRTQPGSSTNAPASTNKAPVVNDLLNQFLKPKKP